MLSKQKLSFNYQLMNTKNCNENRRDFLKILLVKKAERKYRQLDHAPTPGIFSKNAGY
jgi:hypothetical protein